MKSLPETPKSIAFVKGVIEERMVAHRWYDNEHERLGIPIGDPPGKMYWATMIVGAMKKDRDQSKDGGLKNAILHTKWIWNLAEDMGVSFEPTQIDPHRIKFISRQSAEGGDHKTPKKMMAINWDVGRHLWSIERQWAWANEKVNPRQSTTHVVEAKTSKARDEEYGPS